MCGGVLHGKDSMVGDVVTDSRRCAFGDGAMFVAMRGANYDSHDYVGDMYQRGVRAFLVEREIALPEDAGYICVENALEALQCLAAAHRATFKGKVVGITGSNGKTMVKEWMARALPAGVEIFVSPMSYNSQLGVALSLLMIEGDEEVALIEAGISEVGEMARLERMIRPDVVLMTSVGDAHQSNFENVAQKVSEKMILACDAKTFIYHSAYSDITSALNLLPSDCKVVDAANVDAEELPACNEALRVDAQEVKTLCKVLGYDVPKLSPSDVAMRLEVKEGIEGSTIINDSYNSDINSLALALDTLRSVALGGKTTVVISDILQSGMSDEELYERVAQLVAHAEVDTLICVGERIKPHVGKFTCKTRYYASTEEFMRALSHEDIAGRTILLKGNRRSHFERVCHSLERRSHTTVLEVNLDAMTHNVGYFRRHLPMNHRLVAMVKAHSYGAGDVEVAQLMQRLGVSYLAVAFADEGILLREKGITMPIVVLNADAGSFDKMIAYSLEPEIYSFHSLEDFMSSVERYGAHNYPVHIKLDTGMHRLGFVDDDIDLLGRAIHLDTSLRVASIFSHLSSADIPAEDDFTRKQIAAFDYMSQQLTEWLDYKPLRHIANSAAIVRFKEAHFDMCRLGLGLYGFGFEHNDKLIPVATLSTRIVQIKTLAKGESIGYARSMRTEREMITATIPVGYADGLDRHLGNGCWEVLVRGERAKIVGRVCMDSAMIDITDIEGVEVGDKVTIFGTESGNTLEDMARVLDTISYEIMTSISQRVKRIYTER